MQLGTGNDDIPKSLGAVNFKLGVIAQVISFLESGEFDHEDAVNYCVIP
jgi:hypothetical protein